MNKDNRDVAAGEFVLGTMDDVRWRAFEAHLKHDPALGARVAAWEAALVRLEDGAELPPPPEVWHRLTRLIDAEQQFEPFRTVRQGEREWTAIGPGVEKKLLYRDPATGLESCLIRMRPGAIFEAHHHVEAEECLVVEGDLQIGDLQLKAGDYQVATPGTDHPVLRSVGGGVIFVRGAFAPGR